jgi:Helitron helicase-like domain at N-terminus
MWNIQCCGVVDVNGHEISTEDKFYQALHGIFMPHSESEHSSLPSQFPSQTYLSAGTGDKLLVDVCSGAPPCNEYDSQHLLLAFPCLFPFAVGGFGWSSRQRQLGWERQLKYLLQQSHRLFGRHEVFMYVVFNILQRREICLGARIVTRKSSLASVRTLLAGLDSREVKRRLGNVPRTGRGAIRIRDPKLSSLLKLTDTANGFVRGSKQYAADRRSEIRGLCIRYGVPSFFITINPDDVKHPLIVALANEQLETNQITNEYILARYKLLATDPVAQAEFFDVILTAVIDFLFGEKNEGRKGIFGKLAAHFGMVEAQGKGTLHLHCLVWLSEGISRARDGVLLTGLGPDAFRAKLADEEFRESVRNFLEHRIKQDWDWSAEPAGLDEVRGKPPTEHPSYQFPVYNGADLDQWTRSYLRDAKSVAIATQYHKHTSTCRKKGTLCRFGYGSDGKQLVETTNIDEETGEITLKRNHPWANNHNPALAAVTRSNHDLQPVFTKGLDSLRSMYYMTQYTTKSDDDTSDALVLETAFRQLEEEGVLVGLGAIDQMRRLLIRMNHFRKASVQLSGAQVAAMVLGIGTDGTHYTDQSFRYLNLRPFVSFLRQEMTDGKVRLSSDILSTSTQYVGHDLEEEDDDTISVVEDIGDKGMHRVSISLTKLDREIGDSDAEDDSEALVIADDDVDDVADSDQDDVDDVAVDETGSDSNSDDVVSGSDDDGIGLVSEMVRSVEDYIFRGDELEQFSVYEMAMSTVAEDCSDDEIERYLRSQERENNRGRPWDKRVFFQTGHKKQQRRWTRVLRSQEVPRVYSKLSVVRR